MKEITTLYKFGFKYKNVLYGWKDKKLFKLPHTLNSRSYQLKEIPYYCFKSTMVYNVQREKLTINKLKLLTKEINFKIVRVDNSVPF